MNKRILKLLSIGGALVLCALLVTACSSSTAPSNVTKSTAGINHRLEVLEKAEPTAEPLDSADRRVQNAIYTGEADPLKIWYLAITSQSGAIESTYTIQGPVVSEGDEVSNPLQQVCAGGESGNKNCDTIGLAEPNGTYPHGGGAWEAILTSGALLKFYGYYQVSDQPFTVKTPEILSINASAPISHTNASLTKNAVVPTKR